MALRLDLAPTEESNEAELDTIEEMEPSGFKPTRGRVATPYYLPETSKEMGQYMYGVKRMIVNPYKGDPLNDVLPARCYQEGFSL